MDIEQLIRIMIAADGKIKGKTKILKTLFLLVNKYFPELIEQTDFFPYQFGPYSTKAAKVINQMIRENKLIAEKKGQIWEVRLSEEEQKNGIKDLNDLECKNEIIEMIQNINNSSLKSLLAKIYVNYPEYAYNSRIASQVVEA